MPGDETFEVSVGELAAPIKNALVGGPFGSDLGTADYVPTGVPVIRGQNLSNGKFVGGEFVFVSEEKADKLKSNLARPGDLVFTQRGNAVLHGGQVAIVPDQPFERYLVSQSQMKLTPDQTKIESRFLYFIFTSADYRHYLRSNAVVTGVPHINLGLLREYSLSLPPLAEQKAIAAVLGALDDKIELNRRMNATLEAMARALYQSWFVDFDPVRAKLDGRKPIGIDPATAALFPSAFQESKAGHIPNGWTIKPVGEVVDCVGGGTPSTVEPKYWEGGTHHWTTPKDFSSLQAPILLDTDRKVTDVGVAKISSGLLPTGTLLLSSRAPVGYLAIAAMPVAINQGFIAMKCNERASNFFMLNWCQTSMAEIESRATGTTFAEISKQNFRPILVELPPKELMAAFTAKVAPLYAKITANLHQSRTLVTLRDTLLPKLLSGELPIPDAMDTHKS
jgi:type I restriction enzyme S subunit